MKIIKSLGLNFNCINTFKASVRCARAHVSCSPLLALSDHARSACRRRQTHTRTRTWPTLSSLFRARGARRVAVGEMRSNNMCQTWTYTHTTEARKVLILRQMKYHIKTKSFQWSFVKIWNLIIRSVLHYDDERTSRVERGPPRYVGQWKPAIAICPIAYVYHFPFVKKGGIRVSGCKSIRQSHRRL